MEKNLSLCLQFSSTTAGIVSLITDARDVCDSYNNNPARCRREGVLAAWLVDPETGDVCYGKAPTNWRNLTLYFS